jgi:hypothetical protein
VLLVIIAGVLLFAHDRVVGAPPFIGWVQIIAGIAAGFIIGIVASLLGVAGGEFLIPTLVLLFGADIKLDRSSALSSAVYCRALCRPPSCSRLLAELLVISAVKVWSHE